MNSGTQNCHKMSQKLENPILPARRAPIQIPTSSCYPPIETGHPSPLIPSGSDYYTIQSRAQGVLEAQSAGSVQEEPRAQGSASQARTPKESKITVLSPSNWDVIQPFCMKLIPAAVEFRQLDWFHPINLGFLG